MTETEIQEIQQRARLFFPDCSFTGNDSDLETKEGSKILHRQERILPYLQTMLFEEHLVELQIDQGTRLFFSYVIDDPSSQKSEDGDIVEEREYEPGSYLKELESFLISPVTPGVGNPRVRNAQHVVLRFFTGTTAIELGCTFRGQDSLDDVPVLRFDFPVIGKITRNYRSFRVKALDSIEAKALLRDVPDRREEHYQIVDVSAEGMALEMPGEAQPFEQGEMMSLTVMVAGVADLNVKGKIRNVTKARGSKGYKTIYGIQFDLETRALAADLEKMAAAIQRLHLRELAERTADLKGVNLIR